MITKKQKILVTAAALITSLAAAVIAEGKPAGTPPADPGTREAGENPAPTESEYFAKKPDNYGTGSFFYRSMTALMLVVALGAAAMWVTKKLSGRIGTPLYRRITVTDTVHLGNKKTLHIVDIEGQRLLIGSTQDSISRLARLPDLPDQTSEAQL